MTTAANDPRSSRRIPDVVASPIDTLALLDQMELTSRAYLARSIVSSLNAVLIGQLARAVRRQLPDEASGIDGLNEMLAEALEHENDRQQSDDAGLEGYDPLIAAEAIAGCVDQVLDNLDLSEGVREAINQPHETLRYLADRLPQDADVAQARQLAAALDIELSEATAAISRHNRKHKEQFNEVVPGIVDLLDAGFGAAAGFDSLPVRLRLRIAQKIEKQLSTKLGSEVQRVIAGAADRMGDITMLKSAIQAVRNWIAHHGDQLVAVLRDAA